LRICDTSLLPLTPLKTNDCDTYVAWGYNSLKGMSYLRFAGDIVDWQ